jgi:hypothetical protein
MAGEILRPLTCERRRDKMSHPGAKPLRVNALNPRGETAVPDAKEEEERDKTVASPPIPLHNSGMHNAHNWRAGDS